MLSSPRKLAHSHSPKVSFSVNHPILFVSIPTQAVQSFAVPCKASLSIESVVPAAKIQMLGVLQWGKEGSLITVCQNLRLPGDAPRPHKRSNDEMSLDFLFALCYNQGRTSMSRTMFYPTRNSGIPRFGAVFLGLSVE